MGNESPANPFVPGRGQLPPYLAGRSIEQNALMGLLGYVNAGRGATRIDEAIIGDTGAAFRRERVAYYEDRREELERQNLLQLAACVADAFDGQKTLRGRELNAAIRAATEDESGDDTLQRRDSLAAVGYVWKPPEAPDLWQPGISSLMDYVQTHAD